MLFKEYKPNILLSSYIETYWVVNGFAGEGKSHKIFPDGCVDILFSFGSSSARAGLTPFLPNIIGTMTTYSEGFYFRKVNMIGIRFKPAGFSAFTKIPVNEFTDLRVNLTAVETLFDEQFYAELPDKESIEEQIQHIDTYLTQKLVSVLVPKQQIVYAVNLIRQTNGQLRLQDVADKSCLCLRHFEREFKRTVGISPKTFSKIVKFKSALTYLKRNADSSLFSTAIECGYYDQAHLIKDFKTLAGNPPSHFKLS